MKAILLAVFGYIVLFSTLCLADEPTGCLELGEIVVTGTRTPHTLAETPVDTVVITSADIQQEQPQNLVDILDAIPGITTAAHDDLFGSYTWRAGMRGMNFNDGYGLILVDGQRMIGAGQSGGMGEYGIGLNQIPVSMIERIEVVKGPGSALYGSDAMAGVINIITRDPSEAPTGMAGAGYGWYRVKGRTRNGVSDTTEDHGHYRNTSTAHVSFGDTPFPVLGYQLDYAYESAEDNGGSPIDSYRHTGGAKLVFKPSPLVQARLSSFLNHYEKEGYREEDSWNINAGINITPFSGHTLRVNGYRYDWDFEHGYLGYPYGHKHGHQKEYNAGLNYSLSTLHNHDLLLGWEYREQRIDYLIENQDNLIPVDERIRTWSFYGQDEYAVTDWLVVVPGLRYDHHSVFGEQLNPKLSLMALMGEQNTLRLSAGRSFKSPTIRQLYYSAPYEHGSFFIMSNRDLDPERAWGFTASLERAFSRHLTASFTWFRNDIEDMVQRVDTGTLYMDKPLLVYENISSATTEGVELYAKGMFGKIINWRLGYTYTRAVDDDGNRRLTYIPEHSASLLISYRNPDLGIGFNTDCRYSGRQFTNTSNSDTITDHAVVDLNVYKELGNKARIILKANDLFGSSKGDQENFRVTRAWILKLELKI